MILVLLIDELVILLRSCDELSGVTSPAIPPTVTDPPILAIFEFSTATLLICAKPAPTIAPALVLVPVALTIALSIVKLLTCKRALVLPANKPALVVDFTVRLLIVCP